MPGDVLVLGEVVFDPVANPFAVPSKISGGSGQLLGVAKLIGGARVIDAMGPDPAQIKWSGRWRAPNAVGYNDQMIAMAEAGQQISCTWGENFYNVVIPSGGYTYEYISAWEIDYTVELTVLPDVVGGGDDDLLGSLGSLSGLVGNDIGIAMSVVDDLI